MKDDGLGLGVSGEIEGTGWLVSIGSRENLCIYAQEIIRVLKMSTIIVVTRQKYIDKLT